MLFRNFGMNPCSETNSLGTLTACDLPRFFRQRRTACLALSEILCPLHGGAVHQVIDLDLQGVEHRSAVPHSLDFSGLNPGYIDVRGRKRA